MAALSEGEEEARAAAKVGALLGPHMEEWKRRLDSARLSGQQVDMNQLWDLWTWLAEEVHIFMKENDYRDAKRKARLPDRRQRPKRPDRGWWTERMVQTTTLKPQRRTKAGGPMTAPLRECGADGRALRTALAWSRTKDRAPERLGPMPLDVDNSLSVVHRRLLRLQLLRPDEKTVTVD